MAEAATPEEKPSAPVKPPAPKAKKKKPDIDPVRRGMVLFTFSSVFAWIGLCALASVRFFFPRSLLEPKTRFTIGYPADFGFGVSTKFQQARRIWVVRDASTGERITTVTEMNQGREGWI